MTTAVIVIDPAEYGLEEKQSKEITKNLDPILDERKVIMDNYSKVVKMDINEETIFEARKIRLLLQKNRTQGILQWHKVNKEFFLRGGQFLDAIKRKEVDVNERAENQLMEIEKHYEKIEVEKKAKIEEKRISALEPYVEDTSFYVLSDMPEETFQELLKNSKIAFEAKKVAEKKAEEDRIAAEKAAAEGQERIRKENERLQKEAQEKEKALAEERKEVEKERLAVEEKSKKERIAAEESLKKEREAKVKLEAELKANEDEEKQQEAERKEQEKAARLSPDKDKLEILVIMIRSIAIPVVKSNEAKAVVVDAKTLLDKTCTHITDKMKSM